MRRLLPVCLLAVAACAAGTAQALPTYEALRAAWRPSDAVLLDRHGTPLAQRRIDYGVRRLEWVRLEDVSQALRLALLYSEDRRFYEHSGVDWGAVAAAAWGNLWHTRTRGASTITMQLAGLLDDAARRPRSGARGLAEKLQQVLVAAELEAGWRKDQILEAYLNLVPFRGELVGVAAMSAALFDKHPSGLDAVEAALAAALVRAPNAPPAVVVRRACEVLRAQDLAIACAELPGLAAARLSRRSPDRYAPVETLAPHLARRLLTRAGERLRTTLDADLQRLANAVLRRHLAALAARNVEDGAVVVLDNASGDVLAWVGSSGAQLSDASEVDAVLAQRQAGSTLKPFLYGLALERRLLTPASLLLDAPVKLESGAALYVPTNYDRSFKGPVSVRTALASSLNVPAVRAAMLVTPERLAGVLRDFGLSTLVESADYYGYSLALGSADVTLIELANAYRALANGGRAAPIRLRADDPTPKRARVMDARAAFVVGDILSDGVARARTFGFDNAMATRVWSAVKTGTSKDMRDNWCVGFTRRYTVGVWVGNASGAPMHNVSGMHGAAPVWLDLVSALHAQTPSRAPRAPAGLVRATVRFADGIEAPRAEWFLAGTERDRVVLSDPTLDAPHIVAPVDGAILALDPDMPAQRQRVAWRAAGAGKRFAWRLDGHAIGQGAAFDWMPSPGRHRIELVDDGRVVDQAAIEVRGAVPTLARSR
ncbi:MAG: penicillin-binding protein 1C [Burkholderiales bacterium]